MALNNAISSGQVLSSSGTPTFASVTFGSGTALSVYQEGTWTPTMTGSSTAGTTTYTLQQGYYTKIGNMVTIWGVVTGSAATGTGNAVLGAFPFTVKNQANYVPAATVISNSSATWTWPVGSTQLVLQVNSNATSAQIGGQGSAGVLAGLGMQNASFIFQFQCSYQV